MSEDIAQHVDTSFAEFKQGVEESPSKESSIPLFMSDSPEGNKGNAQDEKDKTEE